MDWTCLRPHPGGSVLAIRVTPNARKSEVQGFFRDRLALRLCAPPVEGQANEEAIRWVAGTFGVRPSRVSIIRGRRSRQKDCLVQGLSIDDAKTILTGILQNAATSE